MSHQSLKLSYKMLEERLNRFPQRVSPSETLYKILSILFSEKEAALVAQLPIKPFTAKTAAKIWKTDEGKARAILDELAGRSILLNSDHDGKPEYTLPPPMAGFFEFSLMRTRGDIAFPKNSPLLYYNPALPVYTKLFIFPTNINNQNTV